MFVGTPWRSTSGAREAFGGAWTLTASVTVGVVAAAAVERRVEGLFMVEPVGWPGSRPKLVIPYKDEAVI